MAKAIISSTYDDRYLYFIPLATWCWNKLGVDVICFMPHLTANTDNNKKVDLILKTVRENKLSIKFHEFTSPKHKEATYAQVARLYAACLDLPEHEVLITGDVDMAMFKVPPHENGITIFGSDLVPDGQFPMCYASGTVKEWRKVLKIQYGALSEKGKMALSIKTYQQCLDELLGDIECENMRGNYWGKDQETLWQHTKDIAIKIPRARHGTQFADNRVDRDDINWRAYVNDELVDAHLWRPGYTDENFANILELLTMKYPSENFQWLIDYTNAYKQLL